MNKPDNHCLQARVAVSLRALIKGKRGLCLSVLVISFFTTSVALPLFSSQLIVGHDSMAAYIRVLGMREYLGSGQLFVRWFPDLNWGYGGPMFNFYPPLFYFIAVAVSFLVGQPALAINITLIFFWFLSGVSIFLLVRHYWGGWAGIVSAAAYIYAPFHAVDVYTRGAYAEFASFALFPLILLSFSRLAETQSLFWFIAAAFSVAALFLTHFATCLMFIPFAFLYSILIVVSCESKRWKVAVLIGAALFAGASLVAFYWVPALAETSAIRLDFLIYGRYYFWKNFLEWSAVWSLPWPLFRQNRFSFDGIFFDVGGWHVLLAFLTMAFFMSRSRERKEILRLTFFFVLTVVSLFMVLPQSRFVWDGLPFIHPIQMPWRYLVLTAFGLSVLAGGWVRMVPGLNMRAWGVLVVIVMLGVSALMTTSWPKKESAGTSEPQKQLFSTLLIGEGERTPRWIVRPPTVPAIERVSVEYGQVTLGEVRSLSKVEYEFSVKAASPALLAANIFYYPGWSVYIDEKEAEISPEPISGRIIFWVPYGEHKIRIKLGLTTVQFWSIVVSWSAVFLLLVSALFWKRWVTVAVRDRSQKSVGPVGE